MNGMTLYHGSNVTVEHPLVNIGRRDLDFGPAFYLRLLPNRLPNGQRVYEPYEKPVRLLSIFMSLPFRRIVG